MNALASEMAGLPQSLHRGENELPFVPYQEGVLFQLLQVNTETGLWIIRVRFEPGVTIQKHRHTGEVFAFTIRGSWRYLEYPDINVAGSYLYEPSGRDPHAARARDQQGNHRRVVCDPRRESQPRCERERRSGHRCGNGSGDLSRAMQGAGTGDAEGHRLLGEIVFRVL